MKFPFTWSIFVQNIQVMRMKKVITKDKKSWYLDKFSLLIPHEMYGEQ